MLPLIFAALAAAVGWTIGRGTKVKKGAIVTTSGLRLPSGQVVNPKQISPVAILMQLVGRRLPVSPGLARAAYAEAMQRGDVTTAQQIAIVFLQPPPMMPAMQMPGVVEETEESLRETYGEAEPMKATSTTTFHNQPSQPSVSDVSPQEWTEFLLTFKTKEPDYRGERHIGAFEHSQRRLAQLGIDPASLSDVDAQLKALDKDLSDHLQANERLLNDFTGESVDVNGEKVPVTRSGVLALLKTAGPTGAKGWLTEESQRKSFPHTTEIFIRGNGRF